MMDAIKKRIKHVEELAKNAFSKHKITLAYSCPSGSLKLYHCRNPEDSAYWFHITVQPYYLIMTGDLGELILHRSENMIAWCRGSVRSIDYFAEKVSRNIPVTEFDRNVAADHLDYEKEMNGKYQSLDWEEKKKYSKRLEVINELKEFLADDYNSPDEFYKLYYESELYSDEIPNCKNYTYHFLWCREAIKWFVENVKDE